MKAPRFSVLAAVALAAFSLVAPAHVSAFCEIQEPPTPVPTQVNGTQVEIHLTEGFARVVIIKEFYNPSDQFKEGQVFFPLEKGHELITDLRLKIGNVVYDSSAQDRGDALDEFLEALRTGQDAALVQYDPPRDVYWIAVTIPPRQARTTITTLEMPLAELDGFYAYDYRLSVDARDSVAYLRVHVRVETTASLEEVEIPTHPHVVVARSGSRVAEAWVNSIEEARQSDMQIRFRATGTAVSQLALPSGERYVRYSIDASDERFAESHDLRSRSFLIFVDGSGSMDRLGRWALASDSVAALVDRLAPDETYALRVFRGRQLISMSSGLSVRDESSLDKAREFLTSIRPRGSTNFETILANARSLADEARARGQEPLVFLISDGRATVGPRGLDLENAFKTVSYASNLPISGLAIKPLDRADELTVRNLTHFNHGGFEHVFGDYAPMAVELVLDSVHLPVLRDVRVALPDSSELATVNSQTVMEGGELVVLARTRGAETDALAMQISWDDPEGMERSLPLHFDGATVPVQLLLHRQWVLTRIHTLLDRLRGGEELAVVEELKTLATANRVVTPYTSLLVTIPRETPTSSKLNPEGDLLGDIGFGSQTGFLDGAPAPTVSSAGDFFPRPGATPLGQEARQWEAWRRDRSAPLIVDDEVDRWISSDDRQALEPFLQDRLTRDYPVAFRGNLFTVYEAQGELVGVRDAILDPASEPGQSAYRVVWLAFAAVFVGAIVRVHRESARFRRKADESIEENFSFEG